MAPARTFALVAGLAVASVPLFFGFERLVSDIATRIRYALRDAALIMQASGAESRVVTLNPNGWPGGCSPGQGFRVVLSPYKGNKQVVAADIDVHCADRHHYSTGTDLIVPREMSVDKGPESVVALTLTRTPAGITITGLK